MAQAGYTPLSLYYSTTAAAAPTSGNLVNGELAINIQDEKLYFKNAAGTVKQIAGTGVGGITYGAVKTTTYTAVANDGVLTNTTGGAFTVNLPTTPATGTQVFIADSAGTWATNNLTIGRNGSTIAGSATDLVCDINSVSIQCIYDGTTWDIFAQIGANDTAVVTLNGTQTLTNKTLTAPTITSPTVTGTGTIAAATVTLSSTLSVTGVSTLTGGAVVQGLTVGRGAGAVATNTVVGASAFTTNTTGAGNAAFGGFALGLNSTGNDNTALGYGAGYYLTSSGNTAVGRSALSTASSGSGGSNTAVGFYALQSNTTASFNTAVGYRAGYSNQTGQTVTYLGYEAGYTATGGNNTFIGTQAGYSVTTGAKNTILGRYDGNQNGLDIRTASNKVVASDGDGNMAFHNDSSQWTSTAFSNIDITQGTAGTSTVNTLAITSGTATTIFGTNTNSFSGVFIINDMNQTGACALVVTSGNSLTVVSQSGGTVFVNSSTPSSGQVGLYTSGSSVVVKPGLLGTTNFRLMAFRTRGSQ